MQLKQTYNSTDVRKRAIEARKPVEVEPDLTTSEVISLPESETPQTWNEICDSFLDPDIPVWDRLRVEIQVTWGACGTTGDITSGCGAANLASAILQPLATCMSCCPQDKAGHVVFWLLLKKPNCEHVEQLATMPAEEVTPDAAGVVAQRIVRDHPEFGGEQLQATAAQMTLNKLNGRQGSDTNDDDLAKQEQERTQELMIPVWARRHPATWRKHVDFSKKYHGIDLEAVLRGGTPTPKEKHLLKGRKVPKHWQPGDPLDKTVYIWRPEIGSVPTGRKSLTQVPPTPREVRKSTTQAKPVAGAPGKELVLASKRSGLIAHMTDQMMQNSNMIAGGLASMGTALGLPPELQPLMHKLLNAGLTTTAEAINRYVSGGGEYHLGDVPAIGSFLSSHDGFDCVPAVGEDDMNSVVVTGTGFRAVKIADFAPDQFVSTREEADSFERFLASGGLMTYVPLISDYQVTGTVPKVALFSIGPNARVPGSWQEVQALGKNCTIFPGNKGGVQGVECGLHSQPNDGLILVEEGVAQDSSRFHKRLYIAYDTTLAVGTKLGSVLVGHLWNLFQPRLPTASIASDSYTYRNGPTNALPGGSSANKERATGWLKGRVVWRDDGYDVVLPTGFAFKSDHVWTGVTNVSINSPGVTVTNGSIIPWWNLGSTSLKVVPKPTTTCNEMSASYVILSTTNLGEVVQVRFTGTGTIPTGSPAIETVITLLPYGSKALGV